MQHDRITVGELFRLTPRSTMYHVLFIDNIWDRIKMFQRICLHKWSDVRKNNFKHKICLSSFCTYKRLRESLKKKNKSKS